MMRNTLENKFIHVFSPNITKIMQNTFQLYDQLKHRSTTAALHDKFKGNLHSLHDYIECVGDLFEHKFLVFLCNCTELHWYTFVVVNPSLMYLRGHSSKNGMITVVYLPVGWSSTLWPGAEQINPIKKVMG